MSVPQAMPVDDDAIISYDLPQGHTSIGKGGGIIAKAGGLLYAQDEASCVVYGMPAAAAATGLCKAILPLTEIGTLIRKTVGG